jgi:hypothetical protein
MMYVVLFIFNNTLLETMYHCKANICVLFSLIRFLPLRSLRSVKLTAFVKFQVLTAASMKFRFAFWDVTAFVNIRITHLQQLNLKKR